MDMLLLDSMLVAYCFNYLMEVKTWATVGVVNRLMRAILAQHPLVWKGACIDLSDKKLKKNHCFLIQSMLKNAMSTIICVEQLKYFRDWPGNYRMRWNAKLPYGNPQSGEVYTVTLRGNQPMFISDLPMIPGMPYTVVIEWVGFLGCFKMGISECRAATNIRESMVGFPGWQNFNTVGVHAQSLGCVPFYWAKNGIPMQWIDNCHPDMLNDILEPQSHFINSVRLAMQWNANSVTFQFKKYRNTLITDLPKMGRFHLFIDTSPMATACVQIHPVKTHFAVEEI